MGTVRFGRLFFIHNALPAVRPVNHLVDVDSIVLRETVGAAITQEIGHHGMVVGLLAEADPESTITGGPLT